MHYRITVRLRAGSMGECGRSRNDDVSGVNGRARAGADDPWRGRAAGGVSSRLTASSSPRERIDLLLSWRNSGFAAHNRTTVYPSESERLHKLACYLMRSPVNLSRNRYHPNSQLFFYEPKAGPELDDVGSDRGALGWLQAMIGARPLVSS